MQGERMDDAVPARDRAIALTRAWVERAVIGLNLCPFAKAPQRKGTVRYAASDATDEDALCVDLVAELRRLAAASPDEIETTLLIHPGVLQDFLDFNDFLGVAEAAVAELGLEGVIQVASFHPDYRFADAEPLDVANATNRSPFPTLHLIREESLDRAIEAFPDAEAIYETNIETMEMLGEDGWARLQRQWEADADAVADAGPGADLPRKSAP